MRKSQIQINNLGKKLKILRRNAGLTQEGFAEILGVSRTAVAKWENGYSEPTLQNIVSISNIFHVSSDYLLGLNIEKNNSTFDISDDALCALEIFIKEIKNT